MANIFDTVWTRDAAMARMNPAQIHRRRLTRKFLFNLKINPAKILDIGCGLGELLGELGRVYPDAELFGCDISEAAQSVGSFCKLDAEKRQEFPGGAWFGLVTCCEVLEHCAVPENVVRNAYDWLEPGGVLFVSVPSGPMTGYDRVIGHRHHYTESEMRELLRSQGFQSVTVRSWGFPFHSLYRSMVSAASRGMQSENSNPGKFFWLFWFVSKVFNILFYFNSSRKGRQIFAWACRER